MGFFFNKKDYVKLPCPYCFKDLNLNGRKTLESCPNCNHKLPPQSASYCKAINVCIFGNTASGKTSYFTSLIYRLKNSLDVFNVSYADAETGRHYENNFRDFVKSGNLKATAAGSIDTQRWTLKDFVNDKKLFVSFFDPAGETVRDFQNASYEVKTLLKYSNNFIIMIDGEALLKNDIVSNSTLPNMINEYADYVRISQGLNPDKKISSNVAVVISKLDLLEQYPFTYIFSNAGRHLRAKAFQNNDMINVDREINNFLQIYGQNELLNAIKANFSNFKFFAVSSKGSETFNSCDNEEPSVINGNFFKPFRVEDPFLWFLKEERAFAYTR